MHRQLDGTPATTRLAVARGTGSLGSEANPSKTLSAAQAGASLLALVATLFPQAVHAPQGCLPMSVFGQFGSHVFLPPGVSPVL
jgi:hypothetical protein